MIKSLFTIGVLCSCGCAYSADYSNYKVHLTTDSEFDTFLLENNLIDSNYKVIDQERYKEGLRQLNNIISYYHPSKSEDNKLETTSLVLTDDIAILDYTILGKFTTAQEHAFRARLIESKYKFCDIAFRSNFMRVNNYTVHVTYKDIDQVTISEIELNAIDCNFLYY